MNACFGDIDAAYEAPSMPLEILMMVKVLQALCGVRSDRQLVARFLIDLLFRWSVDLPLDETSSDISTERESG